MRGGDGVGFLAIAYLYLFGRWGVGSEGIRGRVWGR